MKSFFVLSITLLFALVAGCNGGDGNGDDTTADTDIATGTATDEATDPADSAPETRTLCSSIETIPGGCDSAMCPFSIFETGTLEARVRWVGRPNTLIIDIMPRPMVGPPGSGQKPPAVATLEMTDEWLSRFNDWHVVIRNFDGPDVTVECTVWFTPD